MQSHDDSINASSSNSASLSGLTPRALDSRKLTSTEARQLVASAVSNAVKDALPFDEDTTVVMDYACGSGALSQNLAPYSKRIIGVDIDADAVEKYNTRVFNQGIPHEEMIAICVDLKENAEYLPVKVFDIVVCSQGYHHFQSIEETTQLLTKFLKPRGSLFVSDIVKGIHADEFRTPCIPHRHSVVHRGGFSEQEIRASFEGAGLVDIAFEVVETIVRQGRNIDIFLARGVKPTDSSLL